MKDLFVKQPKFRADRAFGVDGTEIQLEQRRSVDRAAWLRYALAMGLGAALVMGAAGCHGNSQVNAAQNPSDPANGNFAPVNGQPAQALGQNYQNEAQQQAQDYTPQQPGAPIVRQAPQAAYPPDSSNYDNGQPAYDNGYDNGQYTDQQAQDAYDADLTDAQATEPPPPLPDYDQPPAPDPDYMWTPGYWAWGPYGYYWVPGCWVAAPYVGALWTPGYWAFVGGAYRFHHGFWGLHIGYYGGIDYGYGYVGHGYYGGYWNGGHFFYNTAVNRVNVNVIRNVYVRNVVVNNTVVNNRIVNRVSYNGGRGGVAARPMPAEVAALHEQRIGPMQSQMQIQRDASQNRAQFFSQNRGRPQVAVNARPVTADRALPAPLPRVATPAGQQGFRGGVTQGQPQGQGQQPAFRSEARPGQPSQVQPGRPENNPQFRNTPENARPAPEARQFPQQGLRQGQPQEGRPVRPQPEARPVQPQPEARPAPQQRPDFQARPQPQQQPMRPQEQMRQAPQPRPQEMARPQQPGAPPQPQPQVQHGPPPQSQQHAAPPPHPQPQSRPAPQPHNDGHGDNHDHH